MPLPCYLLMLTPCHAATIDAAAMLSPGLFRATISLPLLMLPCYAIDSVAAMPFLDYAAMMLRRYLILF